MVISIITRLYSPLGGALIAIRARAVEVWLAGSRVAIAAGVVAISYKVYLCIALLPETPDSLHCIKFKFATLLKTKYKNIMEKA